MSPWTQGQADVEEFIAEGALTRLNGADAGRTGLMARARTMLESAEQLLEPDPVTAFTVAYDAAKHAAMALLAEQNLRATGKGGHLVLEKVLAVQFQGVFSDFGRLRRRRKELDYPSGPEDFAEASEARRAIDRATKIVDAAEKILDQGMLTTF